MLKNQKLTGYSPATTMAKSFEKVKKLTRGFFHYCCFGSNTGDAYGYGFIYSHPIAQHDLMEPFLDDAIQSLVDNRGDIDDRDVEMFVFRFPSSNNLSNFFSSFRLLSLLCQCSYTKILCELWILKKYLIPSCSSSSRTNSVPKKFFFYSPNNLFHFAIDTFSGLKCNQKLEQLQKSTQ